MPLMRYLQLDQKTTLPTYSSVYLLLYALVIATSYIILAELLVLFGWETHAWARLIILVGSLAAVAYVAHHAGRWPSLVSSLLTIGYLAYFLPTELGQFSESNVRVLWVFGLAMVAISLLLGHLSDQLRLAMQQQLEARAEAEDRQRQLEMILQQLPVGVMIVDIADKQISYSNHQAEDLLGIRLTGQGIPEVQLTEEADLFTPELVRSDWPLHRTLEGLETVTDQELQYRRPDGQLKQISVNAAPVLNAAGKPIAAIATVTDVSLAKELEQRKDEFISIASHELKSPVTSLKIYLQLLAKQAGVLSGEEQQTLIGKANNQVNKLAHLMGDLLDLSRLQSGKITYALTPQLIRPLIKEACDATADSLERTITVRGQAERPVRVDAGRLQQVLVNLLGNAAKYSAVDSPILVRIKQDEQQTVLEVVDKGIGIEEGDVGRIFDLFYQGSTSTSRSGLGIGLYVSNEIIKQHGGWIEVESQLGKGSTFRVVLPENNEII